MRTVVLVAAVLTVTLSGCSDSVPGDVEEVMIGKWADGLFLPSFKNDGTYSNPPHLDGTWKKTAKTGNSMTVEISVPSAFLNPGGQFICEITPINNDQMRVVFLKGSERAWVGAKYVVRRVKH